MSRRPTTTSLLVLVPVVLAAAVVVAVLRARDERPPTPAPVDLEAADAVAVGSVAEMAAAARCVLAGEVVHTERGRAIGTDLVSRLVQLRVDEALDGDCPTGTVVLEEEGWLADGRAVTVNGWPGSAEGDVGVWFLVPGGSDELPYASTVSTTGALRWRDGAPMVPASAPPWVLVATDAGPEALADQVRSATSEG